MFLDTPWIDVLLRATVLTPLTLLAVLFWVRVLGLRALSKMTNFDFVTTIALGSALPATAMASDWATFGLGLAVIACLMVLQWGLSHARLRSDGVQDALSEQPTLLMRDGKFLRQAMEASRITEDDLIAKLREANVLQLTSVQAVVLETTGDISVLHGSDGVQDSLLEGVA